MMYGMIKLGIGAVIEVVLNSKRFMVAYAYTRDSSFSGEIAC
jgi:uncharacterized membrane protein